MVNESNPTRPITSITLGRYHLLQRIGRGGMGEDPRLHRQVAIKTLPLHNQSDNEFLQRFEREARAATALNHPYILPVHDYGEQRLVNGQSITYIVMPYVAGGSLGDRIAMLTHKHAGMPQHEAIAYLLQAAEAIDYAHGQGVIHRDIKPGNMLLRSDNWLLLADFGIARMLSDQDRLTQTGIGFGTPEYMAPEQAQGRAEAASDNYSLAVIAYQLFTGQVPFKADTPYATTIQHIISPPPPPRQVNPALSPAVEQVLLHGLAKEPVQRPPSARAYVDELQQAMARSAYEATFVKQPLPPTGGAPAIFAQANNPTITNTKQQNVSSPVQRAGKPAGITRRQVVIGGGAALLLVGGGLGAWVIASTQNHQVSNAHDQYNATATRAVTNSNGPLVLLAHEKPICALGWSPTAATVLASAGKDGQVMLWDVQQTQQGQSQPLKPKAGSGREGGEKLDRLPISPLSVAIP